MMAAEQSMEHDDNGTRCNAGTQQDQCDEEVDNFYGEDSFEVMAEDDEVDGADGGRRRRQEMVEAEAREDEDVVVDDTDGIVEEDGEYCASPILVRKTRCGDEDEDEVTIEEEEDDDDENENEDASSMGGSNSNDAASYTFGGRRQMLHGQGGGSLSTSGRVARRPLSATRRANFSGDSKSDMHISHAAAGKAGGGGDISQVLRALQRPNAIKAKSTDNESTNTPIVGASASRTALNESMSCEKPNGGLVPSIGTTEESTETNAALTSETDIERFSKLDAGKQRYLMQVLDGLERAGPADEGVTASTTSNREPISRIPVSSDARNEKLLALKRCSSANRKRQQHKQIRDDDDDIGDDVGGTHDDRDGDPSVGIPSTSDTSSGATSSIRNVGTVFNDSDAHRLTVRLLSSQSSTRGLVTLAGVQFLDASLNPLRVSVGSMRDHENDASNCVTVTALGVRGGSNLGSSSLRSSSDRIEKACLCLLRSGGDTEAKSIQGTWFGHLANGEGDQPLELRVGLAALQGECADASSETSSGLFVRLLSSRKSRRRSMTNIAEGGSESRGVAEKFGACLVEVEFDGSLCYRGETTDCSADDGDDDASTLIPLLWSSVARAASPTGGATDAVASAARPCERRCDTEVNDVAVANENSDALGREKDVHDDTVCDGVRVSIDVPIAAPLALQQNESKRGELVRSSASVVVASLTQATCTSEVMVREESDEAAVVNLSDTRLLQTESDVKTNADATAAHASVSATAKDEAGTSVASDDVGDASPVWLRGLLASSSAEQNERHISLMRTSADRSGCESPTTAAAPSTSTTSPNGGKPPIGKGRRRPRSVVDESLDSLAGFFKLQTGRLGTSSTSSLMTATSTPAEATSAPSDVNNAAGVGYAEDGPPDALDEYAAAEKKLHKAYSMLTEPNVRSMNEFVRIPSQPLVKQLTFHLFTTWGDDHYIGMTGIEIFDEKGFLVRVADPIRAVAAVPHRCVADCFVVTHTPLCS